MSKVENENLEYIHFLVALTRDTDAIEILENKKLM